MDDAGEGLDLLQMDVGALDPPRRVLLAELIGIVGSSLLALLTVRYAVDIEDSAWFGRLYRDHWLDELLAAGAVFILGIIATALHRLFKVRRQGRLLQARLAVVSRLLVAIPDAVVIADGHGRMLVNHAAAQWLGLPEGRPTQARLADMMSRIQARGPYGMALRPEQGAIAQALDGKATTMEQIWRAPDGGDRRMLASSVPLELEAKPFAALMVATDITDAWETTRRLDQANRELAETHKQRLLLVRMVAHDLANTVSPLRLQGAILETAGSLQQRHKVREVIERAVAKVTRLANDLSTMAKLESGDLKVQLQPADLAESVRQACEAQRPAFDAKGVALECSAAGGMAANLDKERINQVLDNLLSNALKFTPAGGRVTVTALAEPDAWMVRVADTGLGLTPEQTSRLFQAFSRVHDPGVAEGTGLGLFISKGLIDHHHGAIGVESPGPGKGATFWIRLPAQGA